MTVTCAAIDLGASSGRVMLASLGSSGTLSLHEVHRFETPMLPAGQGLPLRWDLEAIIDQVRHGVAKADALAPLDSAGVDTWGVDYVLADEHGACVAPAVCYRDTRADGMMEAICAAMPRADIYRRTGIQFLPFNTLYQLAACTRQTPDWLRRARRLLMVPDYIHFRLSGVMANEYTNATTTQLFRLDGTGWDADLLHLAGVPAGLMGPVVEPGTVLANIPAPADPSRRLAIIAPATHDTASAVAAVPLESEDEAYISSGTWSLMGIESRTPLADAAALTMNMSNEGGVERRYRVLKNIMGLWLVQRIRKELDGSGHGDLVQAAAAAEPWGSIINPEDLRFLNPASMVDAICGFCVETGQTVPEGKGALARCIFDSLSLSYRRVKEELEALRGRALRRIRIVGGGSQNVLLNQLCADACQIPVSAGPVETSVLGNGCVQMIALGRLSGLDEARAAIRRSFDMAEFHPHDPVPDPVWARFQALARHQ